MILPHPGPHQKFARVAAGPWTGSGADAILGPGRSRMRTHGGGRRLPESLEPSGSAGSVRVRFRVTGRVDDAEWSEVAARCPGATFFHTPLWLRTYARAHPGMRVATRAFAFEDGARAILPLVVHRRLGGLISIHASTPATCYGGWISPEPLLPEHARAIAGWAMDHCPNLVWRVNPFEPLAEVLAPYVTEDDSTEILRLADFPDQAALRKNYHYSVRKQAGKGARAGLQVAPARTWDEWEAYFAIYQERLAHWGAGATSSYPLGFFRLLFDADSPAVRLWLARSEEKIIGGNLNFYHGRHAVEWHAVFDSEYFNVGVRDFLVDWIIEDARQRGFAYYDFNPSGGHEGARRFKQTFGTISMPSGVIVRRRGLYRLDALRRAARSLRRLREGSHSGERTAPQA
jgi:CelD/BcsL family acetyltransferase involved in cellulose biosynthesis